MTGITPRRVAAVIISSLLVVAGLTGCTSGTSSKKALTFCTDPTYPPAEFYQVTKNGSADLKRTIAGADIDIARDVAKRTDSKAQFKNIAFDKIIPALLDKKCDAIISFMNDTPDRRKQVAFVDYLAAGQSVMLKKSARPVNSMADLAGRSVAVAKSTTEEDFLKEQSSSGVQMTIKSYDTENQAIFAVQKNRADVYFGDDPIVQATVAADSSLVQGAQLVKPIPIGIALRPGDPRIGGIQKAVKDMYQSGTMGSILTKWKFNRYAINP